MSKFLNEFKAFAMRGYHRCRVRKDCFVGGRRPADARAGNAYRWIGFYIACHNDWRRQNYLRKFCSERYRFSDYCFLYLPSDKGCE